MARPPPGGSLPGDGPPPRSGTTAAWRLPPCPAGDRASLEHQGAQNDDRDARCQARRSAPNLHYERFGFRDLGSHHSPMPQRAPMFLDGLVRSGSAVLLVSRWRALSLPISWSVWLWGRVASPTSCPECGGCKEGKRRNGSYGDERPRPTCSSSGRAPCTISRVSLDDRCPDPDRW